MIYGEPLPAFVDAGAEVAAVLALGRDVFAAGEDGGEGVCAAGEDEGHGWLWDRAGVGWRCCEEAVFVSVGSL